MNYVKHLNTFFSLVRDDKRLGTTHVGLYMALFYYWNFNRFQNPFSIYRENLMQLSKIGSKNTYHKCIKQLHEAKYIYYHPAPSRFQVVRISIVRLDKEEEKKTDFKQLNLFAENDGSPCTDFDTDTVPILGRTSTDFDTGTVPILGHSYKLNNNKLNSVCNTPTEIFKKNKELNSQINSLVGVSKLIPAIQEVEEHFKENYSSSSEAKKFFYYNQGKNWMLTEKLPITDWKSLATKWMLNLSPAGGGGSDSPSQRRGWTKDINQKPINMMETIQQLYELYLKGEKINKFILPEFADHLQLQITDAIKREAIERRTNQLSGSNEASETKLWTAYMKEDFTDQLLINDQPTLIALAKRIAVSKHFQKLKSQNQKIIH